MAAPAAASRRQWSNRGLVRERNPRWMPWLWKWLIGLALASVPLGIYVLHQNECLSLSYRVTELRAEMEDLIEQERRMAMRKSAATSLEAVESWAVTRHGLVQPPPPSIVVVPSSAIEANGAVSRTSEGTEAER